MDLASPGDGILYVACHLGVFRVITGMDWQEED